MPEILVNILPLFLLFPELWPLKMGDSLFLAFFVLVLPRILFYGVRFFRNGKKWNGENKIFVLWLVFTLAGLVLALTEPDTGALLAAFFQQLSLGITGGSLLRRGAKEKSRKKWRQGLELVTMACWAFCLSYFLILPEPVYWILWLLALWELDWIFPQVSR